ncbi:response regulator [Paenibacillus sp. GCM10027628]|uniref:response regulator transcription factor n=1 Tax=Paenibacillus sp. GCM10027628 TaxID=3273413 RepID=UPI0036425243
MPTLMIVDDEETIRQGLALIIERLSPNWEVIARLEDGEQAVQLLKEKQPDLMIIDISMPGMGGLELARYLFEHYPDIYKIILTGHDKFAFAQSALRYDVADYLLKPLERNELVAALRKIESRLEQRAKNGDMGRMRDEVAWEEIRISEMEERLITAIETNDMTLTQSLLRQWAGDLNKSPHSHIAAASFQLFYFFSFVRSRVLSHIDTKLSLIFQREIPWLLAKLSPPYSLASLTATMEEFVAKLNLEPLEQKVETRRVIETVKVYINEHYKDPELKLEALAQLVYMNTNYISELFKQVTGDNFIDYLTKTRMNAAKQLLRETNLKTYEVAERVGYTSAKYFSTLFRRIYGLTPTEYRDRTI